MFLICTIANDLAQYAAMTASFLEAGFNEERCHYRLFDNSAANVHDPYHVINTVAAEAEEPYIIFCHQDVLLNKGHGYNQLVDQLNTLNEKYPNWAVAGNAGCMEDLSMVIRIDDPNGFQKYSELPQRVCSLDENFFVIKTASNLRCSETLSGFHLYATDLCLQAMRRNLSCYVIDFYLTHLSGGNTESEDFQRSVVKFKQHWNQSFTLCLVQTPCTFFYLSRSHIIRRILKSGRIMGPITKNIGLYTRAAKLKSQVQQVYRRLTNTRHGSRHSMTQTVADHDLDGRY